MHQIAGDSRHPPVYEWRERHRERHRIEIKAQMAQGCPPGLNPGADTPQQRGHTGPNTRANHQRKCGRQGCDHPGMDHRKHHADGRPTALNHRGNASRQCHPQQSPCPLRPLHLGQPGRKRFPIRQHRRTHGTHPQKQQPEAQKRPAEAFGFIPFAKSADQKAQTDGHKAIITQFKGDHLHRQTGADVCTDHQRNGLRQRHQARIHKTHQHHRGRRTLHHKSQAGSQRQPAQPVTGRPIHQPPHPAPRHLRQPGRHGLHPEKKQRQPAQQLEYLQNVLRI